MTNMLLNLNYFDSLFTLNYFDSLFTLNRLEKLLSILILIVSSSTVEFLVLYSFTVLTLVATLFRNLIYKVLNIGLMSIFVAALWAQCTDLTFIYVAYVLAFVGAVIMLFLSIVLMLPTSVVSTVSRLNIVSFQNNHSLSVFDTFSLTEVLLLVLFVLALVILFRRLMLMYSGEDKTSSIKDYDFNSSSKICKVIYVMIVWRFHFMGGVRRLLRARSFLFIFKTARLGFIIYRKYFLNRYKSIIVLLRIRAPIYGLVHDLNSIPPVDSKFFKKRKSLLYIFKKGLFWGLSEMAQDCLIVLAHLVFNCRYYLFYSFEVCKYYFWKLPYQGGGASYRYSLHYLRNTQQGKALLKFYKTYYRDELVQALTLHKKVIKTSEVDFVNNAIMHMRFKEFERALSIRLLVLNRYFNCFGGLFSSDNKLVQLHDLKSRALVTESCTALIRFLEKAYIFGPLKLTSPLFVIVRSLFADLTTLTGRWYVLILFPIAFLVYLLNIVYLVVYSIYGFAFRVSKYAYLFIGFFAQLIISVSLFLVAVPFYASKAADSSSSGITGSTPLGLPEAENLAAIQQALYIDNPLFLFITVIALLVALIGAAVMHRRKK